MNNRLTRDDIIKAYKEFHTGKSRATFLFKQEIWEINTDKMSVSRSSMMRTKARPIQEYMREHPCLNFTEIDDGSPMTSDSIKVLKRIGSDSVYGQVYEAVIGDFHIAVKVMPIMRSFAYPENVNEINLMWMCSKIVQEGRSVHFPIVFGDFPCSNVVLPFTWGGNNQLVHMSNNHGYNEKLAETVLGIDPGKPHSKSVYNKFMDRVDEYKSISQVRTGNVVASRLNTTMKNDMNVINVLNRVGGFLYDPYSVYYHAMKQYGSMDFPEIGVNRHTRANLLAMELAATDLKNFLETEPEIPASQMFDILRQIVIGLTHLNQMLGHKHLDLHAGNVLLLFDYDDSDKIVRTYCLLNDMGNAQPILEREVVPNNKSTFGDFLRIINACKVSLFRARRKNLVSDALNLVTNMQTNAETFAMRKKDELNSRTINSSWLAFMKIVYKSYDEKTPLYNPLDIRDFDQKLKKLTSRKKKKASMSSRERKLKQVKKVTGKMPSPYLQNQTSDPDKYDLEDEEYQEYTEQIDPEEPQINRSMLKLAF